jgi:Fe-S oxidoreductase
VTLVEAPQNRERGLCCGGGGGQMWMDLHARKKVNVVRAEALLATGASTVAVGCPHCMTMLEDARAVLGADDTLHVRDIAEIVAAGLTAAQPADAAQAAGVVNSAP